jgi:hypothetical protein
MRGDPVNELQDDDGLAYAGAAEQAYLATLHVGSKEVDHLNARLEDLGGGLQILELGRRPVDGPSFQVGGERLAFVYGLAQQVEQAAQRGLADGHGDRQARVHHFHASRQTVGGIHGHRAHLVVAQVLLDLGDEMDPPGPRVDVDLKRVVDPRQLVPKLDVDHRPDDLYDLAFVHRLRCPPFVIRTGRRHPPPLPGSPG